MKVEGLRELILIKKCLLKIFKGKVFNMKTKSFKVGRDAGDGRFITVEKAKKHPNTTVIEKITIKKR